MVDGGVAVEKLSGARGGAVLAKVDALVGALVGRQYLRESLF